MNTFFCTLAVGFLAFGQPVSASELITGWVQLESGVPVAGVRVWLFDLHNMRMAPIVGTTDAAGYFALPARGRPARLELGANYPNPFNPSTIIPYQLPVTSYVRLDVFNVLGQRIKTLFDGWQVGGVHTAQWDGTDAVGRAVAAGVYLYRLEAEGVQLTQRMVLIDGQAGFAAGSHGTVREGRGLIASEAAYGLVVSGRGIESFVDPAFSGRGLVVVKAIQGAAKRAETEITGLLGDVNNDNQVDIADALVVLVYTLDRADFAAPNQGHIALGDVNEDGYVDSADVLLIMAYVANPSGTMLPDEIAQQTTVTVPDDRDVLVEIYEALGGDDWTDNTNWLSTEPLDQWYGVSADHVGRVIELTLERNNLTGPIPEALGQLNNLEHLNLRNNNLTGPIPEVLGQLDNLTHLDLRNNNLTGPIPEVLGQLDNLEWLLLAWNNLTGVIPEALGQLNNLRFLWIDQNDLTGCVPEALQDRLDSRLGTSTAFCGVPGMPGSDRDVLVAFYEALDGDNWKDNTNWLSAKPLNQWYGVLTDDEGRVVTLWFESNLLKGSLPTELGQLENLEILWLENNQITGFITNTLSQLRNLKTLNLSYNILTGFIPKELGQFESLTYLDLRVNSLSGFIPKELGQVKTLEYLDLSHNDLTGFLPEELGQLENLTYLDLEYNSFTGCSPGWLKDINEYHRGYSGLGNWCK